MAGKKPTDRSFLAAAVTAAPLAAGVSYTGFKISRGRQIAGTQLAENPVSIAARQAGITSVPIPSMENHIAYMDGLSSALTEQKVPSAQIPEIARSAWGQAIKSADPITQRKLAGITARLQSMPAGEIERAISETIATQAHMPGLQKVMRKFRRQVGALTQHFGVAGKLPKISSFKKRPWAGTLIGQADLPVELQSVYQNIVSQLGSEASIMQYTRQGHKTLRFHWGDKGLSFMLPLTKRGTFFEGKSLRTKYISPDIMLFDKEKRILNRMKRHEFLFREFGSQIIPAIQSGRLQGRDLQDAIRGMRSKWLYELETIPNLPSSISDPILARYQQVRGGAVQVLTETTLAPQTGKFAYRSPFQPVVGEELMEAMRIGGLQAGTSPTDVAKGIVMGPEINLARLKATPAAADASRRLEQGLRPYGLTPEAAEAAKGLSEYNKLASPELRALYATKHPARGPGRKPFWTADPMPPHLQTVYLSRKKYAMQMERMGLGNGVAIASTNVTRMLEQQSTASVHLVQANMEAAKLLNSGKLTPGTYLGVTETGRPYNVPDPRKEEIIGAERFVSEGKGEYMTLTVRRRHQMGMFEKFFGDLKAVTRFVSQSHLEKQLSALPDWKGDAFIKGIQVIADMDALTKDRALHNKQMMGALEDLLSQRLNLTSLQGRFFKRPTEVMRIFERAATREGVYSHLSMTTQLMSLAKGAGTTPEEFGRVFGAVPEVLGGDEYQKLIRRAQLSPELVKGMEAGVPVGKAQLFYGGSAELLGAGKMASIEPRMFEILSGSGFGQLGKDIASEFAARAAISNPQRLATHQALMKSLQSFAEGKTPSELPTFDVSRPGFKRGKFLSWMEGLSEEGGTLRLGEEFGDVWIPSTSHLESLSPFKTAGGNTVSSQVSRLYANLAQKGAGLYLPTGRVAPVAVRNEIDSVISQLFKQVAPAGKGIGRLLGGKGDKLLGTSFLMGVSPGELGREIQAETQVWGISAETAERLIGQTEELYGQHLRFQEMATELRGGQSVGAVGWRHPLFSEFSVQPIQLQVIPGLEGPHVMIPSIPVEAKIGGMGSKTLQLGSMIGMAGDLDADPYAVSLVSPDLEKKVYKATMYADNEYKARWYQNQIRTQILKPGKASGETLLSIEEKKLADVRKSGTAQQLVPRISLEMTSARQAILQNLKGADLANAQQLLQTIEQELISAKHLSAAQVGSGMFEQQAELVSQSFTLRNADLLQGQVEAMMSRNPEAAKLLKDDIILENYKQIEEMFGGAKIGSTIPSLDITKTSENIMESLRMSDTMGQTEAAMLLRGRGSVTKQTLPKFLNIVSEGGHAMSGVSKALQTAKNIAGSIGEGMIRHHKAIGFGFLGSLAIATALSSPPKTIGPGKGLNAGVRIPTRPGKASNQMTPESVMPPSEPIGQPTVPSMLHQNSARIEGPSVQIDVQTNGRYAMNMGDFSERIRRMSSGRSTVNLNIRRSPGSINKYTSRNKAGS